MARAIVSRKTLDALIRAKLVSLDPCRQVEALPVAWNGHGSGCNWVIPGWLGDAARVKACAQEVEHYLEFLREQFDIPPQGNEAG